MHIFIQTLFLYMGEGSNDIIIRRRYSAFIYCASTYLERLSVPRRYLGHIYLLNILTNIYIAKKFNSALLDKFYLDTATKFETTVERVKRRVDVCIEKVWDEAHSAEKRAIVEGIVSDEHSVPSRLVFIRGVMRNIMEEDLYSEED